MGSALQIAGLAGLIGAAAFVSWVAVVVAVSVAMVYVGIAMER